MNRTNSEPNVDALESHIMRKFEVCQKLGKGAYGVVWKAVEKKSRQTVALKKCFDAFRNEVDAQRTYREIQYLTELSKPSPHENIITLRSVIRAENDRDIYLVFDFMETDLHAVIRANILENIHKRYIIYQLLKALKYIHSSGLIHRDVKPSNLLLNADCHMKICDFGLCRSFGDPDCSNPVLTDYVATRWYRAPEILMGSKNYTLGVDIWSIGCILGEMMIGRPLFPGTSTMNQLERIIQVLGSPTAEGIKAVNSPFAATMLEKFAKLPPKSLKELIPNGDEASWDFVAKCLHFEPLKRPPVEQLLKHPFVAQFHKPENEPTASKMIRITVNDSIRNKVDDYRERLYADIKKAKQESNQKRVKQSALANAAKQNPAAAPNQEAAR